MLAHPSHKTLHAHQGNQSINQSISLPIQHTPILLPEPLPQRQPKEPTSPKRPIPTKPTVGKTPIPMPETPPSPPTNPYGYESQKQTHDTDQSAEDRVSRKQLL